MFFAVVAPSDILGFLSSQTEITRNCELTLAYENEIDPADYLRDPHAQVAMDLSCSGAESGHIYHRYVSRNKGGKNEFPAILARLGFLARTNARMGGVSLLSFTTQTICMKPKVIRISTVPLSLHLLLQGQLKMLAETYEVLAVLTVSRDLKQHVQH